MNPGVDTKKDSSPSLVLQMISRSFSASCGNSCSSTLGAPSAAIALGRKPSSTEMDRALTYIEKDPARMKELAWLLFNLDEFIYVK